jgi:hypothetical protein
MFSLALSQAQQVLDKDLRAFSLDHLRPHGLAAERERALPPSVAADLGAVVARLVDEITDPITPLVGLEALAFGDPGIAYSVVSRLQASLVSRTTPSARTSFLFYEGFGRGLSELETVATPGADDWRITGRKIAVAHPGEAEFSVLIARTPEGEPVAFAYEGTPAGVRRISDSWSTGSLGAAVAPTGVVELDLVLPGESQVASDGLALAVAAARLLPAAVQLGAAAAAVDYAVGWVTKREAWGRPLSSNQGVAFKCVEVDTAVDAARLELWDTAVRLAAISDPVELDRRVALTVRAANNVGCDATREGIQLLGVHGIVTENPVERFWRHASTISLIDFDPLTTSLSLV